MGKQDMEDFKITIGYNIKVENLITGECSGTIYYGTHTGDKMINGEREMEMFNDDIIKYLGGKTRHGE